MRTSPGSHPDRVTVTFADGQWDKLSEALDGGLDEAQLTARMQGDIPAIDRVNSASRFSAIHVTKDEVTGTISAELDVPSIRGLRAALNHSAFEYAERQGQLVSTMGTPFDGEIRELTAIERWLAGSSSGYQEQSYLAPEHQTTYPRQQGY